MLGASYLARTSVAFSLPLVDIMEKRFEPSPRLTSVLTLVKSCFRMPSFFSFEVEGPASAGELMVASLVVRLRCLNQWWADGV